MVRRALITASIVCVAATTALAAVPVNTMFFFDGAQCPTGWARARYADGRLIVSVNSADKAGVTVGQPLKDKEDRRHGHAYETTLALRRKNIAAIDCCDRTIAHEGNYPYTNASETSTSNYPLVQTILCRLESSAAAATMAVAYGTVAFFDPDVNACPAGWGSENNVNGRILVPGVSAGAVLNRAPALSSGEDRKHAHGFDLSFTLRQTDDVGAEGGLNRGTASDGVVSVAGKTNVASTNLPYIQLLTCVSKGESFKTTNMPNQTMFYTAISCPPGWVQDTEQYVGRMIAALPENARSAGIFGRLRALNSTGMEAVTHKHSMPGSASFPPMGVGLASGCCAKGYASTGSYSWRGDSHDSDSDLPFTMLPLCRRARG